MVLILKSKKNRKQNQKTDKKTDQETQESIDNQIKDGNNEQSIVQKDEQEYEDTSQQVTIQTDDLDNLFDDSEVQDFIFKHHKNAIQNNILNHEVKQSLDKIKQQEEFIDKMKEQLQHQQDQIKELKEQYGQNGQQIEKQDLEDQIDDLQGQRQQHLQNHQELTKEQHAQQELLMDTPEGKDSNQQLELYFEKIQYLSDLVRQKDDQLQQIQNSSVKLDDFNAQISNLADQLNQKNDLNTILLDQNEHLEEKILQLENDSEQKIQIINNLNQIIDDQKSIIQMQNKQIKDQNHQIIVSSKKLNYLIQRIKKRNQSIIISKSKLQSNQLQQNLQTQTPQLYHQMIQLQKESLSYLIQNENLDLDQLLFKKLYDSLITMFESFFNSNSKFQNHLSYLEHLSDTNLILIDNNYQNDVNRLFQDQVDFLLRLCRNF